MAFAKFAKLCLSFKCFVEFIDVCVVVSGPYISLFKKMVRRLLTVLALSGKEIQSFHAIGAYTGEGYSSQTFR